MHVIRSERRQTAPSTPRPRVVRNVLASNFSAPPSSNLQCASHLREPPRYFASGPHNPWRARCAPPHPTPARTTTHPAPTRRRPSSRRRRAPHTHYLPLLGFLAPATRKPTNCACSRPVADRRRGTATMRMRRYVGPGDCRLIQYRAMSCIRRMRRRRC